MPYSSFSLTVASRGPLTSRWEDSPWCARCFACKPDLLATVGLAQETGWKGAGVRLVSGRGRHGRRKRPGRFPRKGSLMVGGWAELEECATHFAPGLRSSLAHVLSHAHKHTSLKGIAQVKPIPDALECRSACFACSSV